MDSSDGPTDEPFEREFGRFLLVAYASGDDVEGEWHLMDTDRMVPDINVIVTRLDSGPPVPAFGDGATFTPSGPADFKRRLQAFVLEQFADGADIEGTWNIRFARGSLPDWEVSIATGTDFEAARTGDGVSRLE